MAKRASETQIMIFVPFLIQSPYNDYLLAKSKTAFRRAALRRSKTAQLFCQLFIAMSIGRMIQKSFAAKPVVWQRNQSKPRLIPLSDDHYRKREAHETPPSMDGM
ncbi:MAG: hypothetical protein IJQ02_02760 [Oscillospiraceae bacterium]|nr:hypothetical protein [Oscillospiraceae bacterium]